MIELTPDNVLDYLRQSGRIGPGPARVTPLGWGVSNAVFRVETPERLFVLKQSRPQLRTRDLWLSDIDRVYREQEVMEALAPHLDELTVPRILFVDRDNYAFAMSHAPLDAAVWKEYEAAGQTLKLKIQFFDVRTLHGVVAPPGKPAQDARSLPDVPGDGCRPDTPSRCREACGQWTLLRAPAAVRLV